MGWDAGWCMPRTHSAAPHAHRYMVSSSLTSLAAAVLYRTSVEGLLPLVFKLEPVDDIFGEISPRMCLLIAFRRIAACD